VLFLSIFCQFCIMSLFLRQDIKRNARLGIWHITESVDYLLKLKNLPEDSRKVLDTFTHEHRKKEWLAARILTEMLTGDKEEEIQYDKFSKPNLKNSDYKISISHSHNLLAVMLAEKEVGIDIEIIKQKILNIREKFMSPDELNSVRKDITAERATLYWCAKESLYKLYGKKELEFKKHLPVEPFEYQGEGAMFGWIKNDLLNKRFRLDYQNIECMNEHYLLTYVIDED
jgi:4'-phosphopantetheinyl transferase